MKKLFVIIEHRKFTLNVQDEYYDKLIYFFSINNKIDLSENNSLSDILSVLIKSAIETIDIDNSVSECIEKITNIDNVEIIDTNEDIDETD